MREQKKRTWVMVREHIGQECRLEIWLPSSQAAKAMRMIAAVLEHTSENVMEPVDPQEDRKEEV